MRALTVRQPWATLLVWTPPGADAPLKRAETRGWPPPRHLIGGDVAIHAAARPCRPEDLAALPREADGAAFPLGAVLGVGFGLSAWRVVERRRAHGVAAALCEDSRGQRVWWREDGLGDWRPGAWLWRWRLVAALPRPVPARGRQGTWEWA